MRQNGSELAAGGACASKRPGAGGNIGGRRRADLAAQDFDFHGWRCACCGSGDVAVAQHIDGKKRCYACNEIKLLEKEFGTDRTARDGHARAARCATPQPEQ
jgi:hypothetical protein